MSMWFLINSLIINHHVPYYLGKEQKECNFFLLRVLIQKRMMKSIIIQKKRHALTHSEKIFSERKKKKKVP